MNADTFREFTEHLIARETERALGGPPIPLHIASPMSITIYQIPETTSYPWHWQITTQCGKILAEGYERGEQDAIAASHATLQAIAEGDA